MRLFHPSQRKWLTDFTLGHTFAQRSFGRPFRDVLLIFQLGKDSGPTFRQHRYAEAMASYEVGSPGPQHPG